MQSEVQVPTDERGVIAHSMLNGVASLHAAATLLQARWRELSDEVRDELLSMLVRQSTNLSGVLQAIIPNMSDELRAELLGLLTTHGRIATTATTATAATAATAEDDTSRPAEA